MEINPKHEIRNKFKIQNKSKFYPGQQAVIYFGKISNH